MNSDAAKEENDGETVHANVEEMLHAYQMYSAGHGYVPKGRILWDCGVGSRPVPSGSDVFVPTELYVIKTALETILDPSEGRVAYAMQRGWLLIVAINSNAVIPFSWTSLCFFHIQRGQ